MNPMNMRRRIAAGVILGVVFVALEFLINGFFLRFAYQQPTYLWRPASSVKGLFGLMTVGQFIFGVFFGLIFAQGYEPRRAPLGQGFRYGLIMALMLAPMNSLSGYVTLSIPFGLCLQWFFTGFAEMLILGIIASFVYKPSQ